MLCEITILADMPAADIGAFAEHIGDQSSQFWLAKPGLSASVTVGQVSLAFECPKGSVMSEGSCRRDPVGHFSAVVGTACAKCPAGQTNNDARDGCEDLTPQPGPAASKGFRNDEVTAVAALSTAVVAAILGN